LRINREIRADRVRLIAEDGTQIGVVPVREALRRAEEVGLDLVEIAPSAVPPVCKIINYGKLQYQITKKEKENRKAQHQVKVKEIKFKPNIDDHDFETKAKHAREFLLRGDKLRITCIFRGREMLHMSRGEEVVSKMCKLLEDIASVETPIKSMGKMITVVVAPNSKKSKEKKSEKDEDVQGPGIAH